MATSSASAADAMSAADRRRRFFSLPKETHMAFETLLTEIDGAAYVITLNNPQRRNAISIKMTKEIAEACKAAEADASVRAVILTGGREYFSAGADLNEAGAIKSFLDAYTHMKNWETLTETIEMLQKPVIAAVEGFAITGGWELAMACDIRIAGEGASFMLTGSRIGTVPGGGGTQRLPREVGLGRALEIHFSGEPVDAQEAYRIGAVNRLVPKGTAIDAAKKMVKVYEQRAPLSLARAKRALRAGMQMDMKSALEYERFLVTAVYSTEDRNEGIQAFLQKRPAAFKGQ
jgi:enoyl-CoA hydratase/carnithine racemase